MSAAPGVHPGDPECLSALMHTPRLGDAGGGTDGSLISASVGLWIPVFLLNSPATLYFSEPSNNCSIRSFCPGLTAAFRGETGTGHRTRHTLCLTWTWNEGWIFVEDFWCISPACFPEGLGQFAVGLACFSALREHWDRCQHETRYAHLYLVDR